MTITLNAKAYNYDAAIDSNANQMTGPSHSVAEKDILALRREQNKANGTRPATTRVRSKFTRTLTNAVTGEKFDSISEHYVLVPTWATQAQVDSLRDDHGDLLVSTNGADLYWKLDIYQ
ncbi:MAG: hypothetical protein [Sanya solspi-like virus 1]|nr:MAG: hypothetical protein [Sanya solspi-like virus 1]UUW21144.1 MAG: hypothetical protein [Sanya solspi-like virus 1]